MKNPETIYVNPYEVMFVVRRDRDPAQFAFVKDSIRQLGQRDPLKVQDISSWKPAKRKRPDGGHYKWRAAFGQGRCTAAMQLYEETGDKQFLRVPAIEIKAKESELAGMSMTENMLRRDYSWAEQGNLMRRDLDNFPLETVARGYSVSVAHLKKVLKVLQRLNPKLEKALKSLTFSEASSLTTLPAESQSIVLEVLHDEGLRSDQVPALVRKARELSEDSPELSKSALKASLRRTNEDLQRARDSIKPLRLHFALGSQNVAELLQNKKHQDIRAAIEMAGINIDRFQEVYNQ